MEGWSIFLPGLEALTFLAALGRKLGIEVRHREQNLSPSEKKWAHRGQERGKWEMGEFEESREVDF